MLTVRLKLKKNENEYFLRNCYHTCTTFKYKMLRYIRLNGL